MVQISDLQGRVVADGLVLLSYRSRTAARSAVRASLWQRQDDGWRLRFHQGTVLPTGTGTGAARDDAGTDRAVRYGVFLVPDPRVCAAVTAVTTQIEAQYGLVSARAFPPHVTLAGSLPLAGEPTAALATLLAALDGVAAGRSGFPLACSGIAMLGNSVVYDVHSLAGATNPALLDLVAAVDAGVTPLLGPTERGSLAADVRRPGDWHGHLSLASHELDERPDLRDEVLAYARALDVPVPATSRAAVLALYRFDHPDWRGRWWTDLRWTHVRSWHLR